MAAITAVLCTLRQGDHVVAGHDIYGGTYRLFETVFPRFGVTFSFVDMSNVGAVEEAILPDTRMLWMRLHRTRYSTSLTSRRWSPSLGGMV